MPNDSRYRQSVLRQITVNRARTPTERFLALCELLDAAWSMAPTDEAARQRRLQVDAARQQERERWRAEYKRLIASNGASPSPGILRVD